MLVQTRGNDDCRRTVAIAKIVIGDHHHGKALVQEDRNRLIFSQSKLDRRDG